MNFYIGIDLGGTKTSIGLFGEKGNLISKDKFLTNQNNGHEEVFKKIITNIREIANKKNINIENIKSIGLAIPGLVNSKNGSLKKASNFPGWENLDIEKLFRSSININTFIVHDVRAMTIAEKLYGYGREKDNFICITIGTGIGLGLFLNGKIYKGSNGLAGELSHICIDPEGLKCQCGNFGCLETLASGPAMEKIAEKEIKENANFSLKLLKTITAKDICEAAIKGDDFSKKVVLRVGNILGIVISNLITILDPSIVILSGGLVDNEDLLLNIIKNEVKKRPYIQENIINRIVRSKLSGDAVLIGAMEFGKLSLKEEFRNG